MMEQGGGGRGRGGRPRGQGRRFGVQERRRNDEQHTGLEPRDDYALTPTRSASQSGERTPNNPRAGRADATERHNARSRFEPPPRRTRVRGRDSFVPPPMQEYHQAKEALDLVLEVFRPGPSDNWRGIETELDTQEQDKVYAVLKSAVAPADNVMHDRWNSDFSTNVQDNLELVCATIEKSGFLLVEDCEPARSKDTNPAQLGHSTSWLSGKVSKPRPFFPLYPTAHTVTGVWASKNEDEGPVHLEKNFQKRFMPLQDHKRNPRPEFRIDRIYTFGFDTKPTSHIGLQLATLDLALPMRKRRGQMDDDSVIVLKYMAKELYEKDLDDHRKCIGLKEADEKAIHQRIELTRKEKARKAEEKVDGAPSRAAQSNADGALSEEGIGREEDECGQTCPQSAHALRESVGGAEDADLKPGYVIAILEVLYIVLTSLKTSYAHRQRCTSIKTCSSYWLFRESAAAHAFVYQPGTFLFSVLPIPHDPLISTSFLRLVKGAERPEQQWSRRCTQQGHQARPRHVHVRKCSVCCHAKLEGTSSRSRRYYHCSHPGRESTYDARRFRARPRIERAAAREERACRGIWSPF